MQFLSIEWAKAYCQAWNNNEKLTKALASFSNRLQYRCSDKELPPIQLVIENGKCTYAGAAEEGKKVDFDMYATCENWKKIANGEVGPRAAMLTKKLGFKGSMITAMKYMSAFEESLRMMSQIEATF